MNQVSVVIPCYNAASFIRQTLQSVQEQSLTNLEVICVNDGSKDETLLVLNQWKKEHGGIQILDQSNQGATAARNRGLELARAEYIQFLDSDDLLLPNKIAHQLQIASQANSPDIIVGSYEKVDEQMKVIFDKSYTTTDKESPWIRLMKTDLGITSANLFRREAVLAVGGWNESLKSSQEYDLMFRMLQKKESIAYDSMIQTKVIQRPEGSITSSSKGANWKRYIALRLQIRSYVLSSAKPVVEQEMNQLLFDAIRMLYPYDQEEAIHYFEQEIPKGFQPNVSAISSPVYVKLFKLFGFKRTEWLRSKLEK